MTKEDELRNAIRIFHRVYYSVEGGRIGALQLHHAAEYLFDAAEITSSVCPDGKNIKFWKDALDGKPPSEELKAAWDRILNEDIK